MTAPVTSIAARFQNLNPVLDRELRQRSRSAKSVVMMSLLLLILTGVLYLVFIATEQSNQFQDPLDRLSSGVGAAMFEWVLFAELFLLLLIIPGVSASAISGERDRQTLIPLQITLMSRNSIFFGKVAASSAFVLLLLVASAPLLAVPYLLGGISLFRILLGFFATLATGVLYATLGVACSTFFRRTQTATLMTYVLVVFMTVGTVVAIIVLQILSALGGDFNGDPPWWPLYANPFVGLADAAGEFGRGFNNVGPFSGIKESIFGDNFRGQNRSNRPDFLISLGVQATFVGLWVILALRRLKLPRAEVD